LDIGSQLPVAHDGVWCDAKVISRDKLTMTVVWRHFPKEDPITVEFSEAKRTFSKCKSSTLAQKSAVELQELEAEMRRQGGEAGDPPPSLAGDLQNPVPLGTSSPSTALTADSICPLCQEFPQNPRVMDCCSAVFCGKCFDNLKDNGNGSAEVHRKCPVCRQNIPSLRGRRRISTQEAATAPLTAMLQRQLQILKDDLFREKALKEEALDKIKILEKENRRLEKAQKQDNV